MGPLRGLAYRVDVSASLHAGRVLPVILPLELHGESALSH